ncbi:MAG TPA: DUF2339 domain-containing protein [Acidobacteriota bacterium]|nr:DUF2339 domain-containing protein [Acidobacteriota bacterium]HQG91670.1 DUF2339 domain-containing protein [Acidobacteriota bacterium]
MKCPQCHASIAELARHCMQCGHRFSDDDLERIRAFQELRQQLQVVRKQVRGVWENLDQLDGRVTALSERLVAASAESQPKPQAAGTLTADQSATPEQQPKTEPAPAPIAPSQQTPHAAARAPEMEVRLGQKWILAIGVIIIVLAVGYFLKYSFDRAWIGPAGRVALAFVWGIGLLVAGELFRRRSYRVFGLCLAGGGVAVLYFATFAGFQIYQLFGQALAFGVMVLITALGCALAVVYDNKWLAALAMIGGFLTPLLLSTGQDNQIALMTYLTVLNLGLLAIAFRKQWALLNALGFIFTYIIYFAWGVNHYNVSKFWPAIIFLNIFYLIYTLMPFAYQCFHGRIDRLGGFLIITPNSLLAFGVSYGLIADRSDGIWASVVSVAYAFIFLALAAFLERRGQRSLGAFVVLLAKAMLFLFITVPIIFSDHWITVFWAAQAVALVWMGLRLARPSLQLAGAGVLTLAGGKLLLWDYLDNFDLDLGSLYFPAGYMSCAADRWLSAAVVIGLTIVFYRLVKYYLPRPEHQVLRSTLATLAAIGWSGLLFCLLNLEVSAFFYDYLPTGRFAAVSVLWSLYSVMLMLLGFRWNRPSLRRLSLALFSLTILKVLIWDMAEVKTPYRIISCFVLGLLLVGVSYLYHRYKEVLLGPRPEGGKPEGQS